MATKVHNRKPTLRQKNAIQIILANHGKLTTSEAMRQAGYSEAMARNPQYLTRTLAFREMIENLGITDECLAQRHTQLLNAVKLADFDFPASESDERITSLIEANEGYRLMAIKKDVVNRTKTAYFTQPDDRIRLVALDLALKLKGHYKVDPYVPIQPELTLEEAKILEEISIKNAISRTS